MRYEISKIQNGLQNVSKICEFDFDGEIKDFTGADNQTCYFISDNAIGKVDTSTAEIKYPCFGTSHSVAFQEGSVASLFNPQSLHYSSKNKMIYVGCYGGRQIGMLDVQGQYVSYLFQKNMYTSNLKFFTNLSSTGIVNISYNGKIFYTCSNLHRVFSYNNNEIQTICGDGKSGFSISNNPLSCRLSHPQGLVCVKNKIFIADSGNKCIRVYRNNTLDVYCGFPTQDILKFPTKLEYLGNLLYVLDGNKVLSISPEKRITEVVFGNILSISNLDKDNLLILRTNQCQE